MHNTTHTLTVHTNNNNKKKNNINTTTNTNKNNGNCNNIIAITATIQHYDMPIASAGRGDIATWLAESEWWGVVVVGSKEL